MFKSSSERTKKVYPDWSSKPVNVYACMNMSFEAFFYEKKRMVLSQNKWPTTCPPHLHWQTSEWEKAFDLFPVPHFNS